MYSWRDKLADWASGVAARLELTRAAWARIGLAAGITLALVGIILGVVIPGLRADLTDYAQQSQDAIAAVEQESGEAQSAASQFQDRLDAFSQLLNQMGNRLGITEAAIDGVNETLDELVYTPPEAYVSGPFGDYTLHLRSPESGNFTAYVHMVYCPSVGNATNYTAAVAGFYAGVNWTEPGVWNYLCAAGFNGTAWGINEVWFNAGTFWLEADKELAHPVSCPGLNSTWVPAAVYVEAFKAAGA